MTELTNFSSQLKELMQQADIASYRALAEFAGVSRWQVQQLRQGRVDMMRVSVLLRFAEVLQVSLTDLLERFGVKTEAENKDAIAQPARDSEQINSEQINSEQINSEQVTALKREYQRLQQSAAEKLSMARSQFQADSLRTLESWLVQWPLIKKRAKERGAALPAEKVLPFIKPVETLMAEWGVDAIAPVDAQVPYDPQYHQLTGTAANAGELVTVTHSGATHNGKILHRAKVKG